MFIKIILKELNYGSAGYNYLKWINDSIATKFTEINKKKFNILELNNYIKNIKKSQTAFLFGIYLNNPTRINHIGNLKLNLFKNQHLANISYIIERKFWGMGIGTILIKKIRLIAKKRFRLKMLEAGVYRSNIASQKILKKNNFQFYKTYRGKNTREVAFKYVLKL